MTINLKKKKRKGKEKKCSISIVHVQERIMVQLSALFILSLGNEGPKFYYEFVLVMKSTKEGFYSFYTVVYYLRYSDKRI